MGAGEEGIRQQRRDDREVEVASPAVECPFHLERLDTTDASRADDDDDRSCLPDPFRYLLAPTVAELDVRAIEPDVEPTMDKAVGNDTDVLLVAVTVRDEDVRHDGQGSVIVTVAWLCVPSNWSVSMLMVHGLASVIGSAIANENEYCAARRRSGQAAIHKRHTRRCPTLGSG